MIQTCELQYAFFAIHKHCRYSYLPLIGKVNALTEQDKNEDKQLLKDKFMMLTCYIACLFLEQAKSKVKTDQKWHKTAVQLRPKLEAMLEDIGGKVKHQKDTVLSIF
jgi:hypothetical protein